MPAFTSGTTTASISRAVAMLALAGKYPLRVSCLGEARYLDDDAAIGDYCAARKAPLGECDSIAAAIAFIERSARQPCIDIPDDSAVSFSPRLFIVEDDEHCLVLAGVPAPHGIEWCDPVASDAEARGVVNLASKLRGEAFREAGSSNHAAARALCFRASALEGRLVHPDWRQAAKAALLDVSSVAPRRAA